MTLEEIERAFIAAAIKKHSGNLSLVAKELGISRGALYRKIEKHGL
jgi:transcriptional regulator of acetoin/glycerol metabolism